MPNDPEDAIANVAAQSAHGPRFEVGLCKRKTREAYGVPSDGSKSAAAAWARTKHRIAPGPVRGALRWYLGGADGYGHVTIDDGKGGEWSVDITRPGYWDHVPVGTITRRWPNLRYVGTSLDIDGVKVVELPPRTAQGSTSSSPSTRTRLARINNLWTLERIVELELLEATIRAGQQPAAREALIARDAITAAMRRFKTQVLK